METNRSSNQWSNQDHGTLVIHINLTRATLMLVAGLVIGAALMGLFTWGAQNATASGQIAPAAPSVSTGMRKYFLTSATHAVDTISSACGAGFHFASMFEILDPTNLRYDTDNPLAYTTPDSGMGPPSYGEGWIRTGMISGVFGAAGTVNCNAYQSTNGDDQGTLVGLLTNWGDVGKVQDQWDAFEVWCDEAYHVWCIEN